MFVNDLWASGLLRVTMKRTRAIPCISIQFHQVAILFVIVKPNTINGRGASSRRLANAFQSDTGRRGPFALSLSPPTRSFSFSLCISLMAWE